MFCGDKKRDILMRIEDIFSHVSGNQNRNLKPKDNVFLNLTKRGFCDQPHRVVTTSEKKMNLKEQKDM